jgi:hypothetical protein
VQFIITHVGKNEGKGSHLEEESKEGSHLEKVTREKAPFLLPTSIHHVAAKSEAVGEAIDFINPSRDTLPLCWVVYTG